MISVFHPKLKYCYDKFQLKRIIPKNIKNILKFFFQKEIEIETKIPESNKKNIKKYFYQSNILFENNSGLKLPKEYFE